MVPPNTALAASITTMKASSTAAPSVVAPASLGDFIFVVLSIPVTATTAAFTAAIASASRDCVEERNTASSSKSSVSSSKSCFDFAFEELLFSSSLSLPLSSLSVLLEPLKRQFCCKHHYSPIF